MADDINKQVQWFDHQFVRAREFNAEQAYHNARRWMHTSGFHSAGIVRGLDVTRVAATTTYHVADGFAVDNDGREAIVLPPGIDVTSGASQSIYIQSSRVSSDPSDDPGLGAFNTRWDETPLIVVAAAAPANSILLAEIDATGAVNLANRQEVEIRVGDTIRSRDIREAHATSTDQSTNTGSGVKTGHIANSAVTSAKIAPNSIQSAHIVVADAGNDQTTTTGNGVKRDHIKNEAVSAAKIAPLAIQSSHVALADAGTDQTTTTGAGVKRAHIKDDAVNQDKIASVSIQSRHLALADAGTDQTTTTGSGVKTPHIKDGAITNAKIADGTIAPGKLDLTLPFPATTVEGQVTLWNQSAAVTPDLRVPLRWIANNRGALVGSLEIQRTPAGTHGGLAIAGAAVVDLANLNTGALAPGLTFGNAGTEGIASKRNFGGNQLGLDLYTNSQARLSITNAGSIGIGTATPQRRLHVHNSEIHAGGLGGGFSFGDRVATEFTEAIAGDRWVWYSVGRRSRLWTAVNGDVFGVTAPGHVSVDLRDSNTGAASPGIAFGAFGSGESIASKRTAGGNLWGLDLYTAGQARLSITNGGNVGIGTTTPSARLQVVGGAVMPAVGNSEAAGIQFPPDPGGGGGDRAYIRYFVEGGETTKLLIGCDNDADDRIAFRQFGAERMTISGGSVGIATANPQRRLHVHDSEIHSGGPNGGFSFGDRVAAEFPQAVAGDRWVWYSSSRRARLWTSVNGDRLTVLANGNVGIGTSSPTFTLEVNGTIRATSFSAPSAAAKLGYVLDQFVNALGETLEEGDVVVLGETEPRHSWGTTKVPIPEVDLAAREYDTRVCGIVAQTWSEVLETPDEDGATVRALTPDELDAIDATRIEPGQVGTFVTLGAFASCKVDADVAPIAVGDVLTTSATRGHAQKVLDPAKAAGAIVGKAMGSLESGKGRIPVLVLLH